MLIKTACARCGEEFQAASYKARYCKDAHRTAAYRDRRKARELGLSEPAPGVTTEGSQNVGGSSVHTALATKLQAIHRDGSAVGQALLAVGRRIDQIDQGRMAETGAGLSSLVLRLSIELDKLDKTAVTAEVDDEVAKARERRDRKRNAR